MFASKEPPAPYEWWLYPVLAALTIAWKSYPLHFYWHNLISLENLLFALASLLEAWHLHKSRPWLALIILMALSAGLSFTLLNLNTGLSAKWLYWIMIALFGYLWLLGKGSELFDSLVTRLRKKR
jgi:hypothetical protein